jgi:hypothetical protein
MCAALSHRRPGVPRLPIGWFRRNDRPSNFSGRTPAPGGSLLGMEVAPAFLTPVQLSRRQRRQLGEFRESSGLHRTKSAAGPAHSKTAGGDSQALGSRNQTPLSNLQFLGLRSNHTPHYVSRMLDISLDSGVLDSDRQVASLKDILSCSAKLHVCQSARDRAEA